MQGASGETCLGDVICSVTAYGRDRKSVLKFLSSFIDLLRERAIMTTPLFSPRRTLGRTGFVATILGMATLPTASCRAAVSRDGAAGPRRWPQPY